MKVIGVKDHKEDFSDKISCRLINPSKSDIVKISKHIFDKVNQKLKQSQKTTNGKILTELGNGLKRSVIKIMHHFLYLTLKFLTLDIIKGTRRCHQFR